MSRAGRRLPALVRIMQLISEIVINQNSKYAESVSYTHLTLPTT